ncbi:MAG TPA: GAF domain-containing protein, partial [Armatimonadota bacterium]|nr:GAF domain-containing protein [Armatimonadota bacterium]
MMPEESTRQEARDALPQGEALLRQFIAQLPVAVAMLDREMRYLCYSRRWLTDYNLDDRDLTGISLYDIYPQAIYWKEQHQRVLGGAVERSDAEPVQREDGSTVWLRWECLPWRDDAGNISGVIIFSEDVSEQVAMRQQTEESAAQARADGEQLKTILHALPVGVIIAHAPDGPPLEYNLRVEEIFGRALPRTITPEDVELGQMYHADGRLYQLEEYPLAKALYHGVVTTDQEIRIRRGDGSEGYILINASPLIDQEGKITAAVAAFIDITARKRAEKASRLDETRLESLLQLSQMAEASIREIADFTLDAATRLTGSPLGYLALVNDDESLLTMHAWSKQAMQDCAISNKPREYPMATVGLWGETVRQRRPIITNAYQAPNTLKMGYPAGHIELTRHMNIPIFEGEHVVAVLGVGNKEEPYQDADVRQLDLLGRNMWQIFRRRRAEDTHKFLAEVGTTLTSTLDYEATLVGLARLLTPTLADWCVVDICTEEGDVRRIAAAHCDPEKEPLVQKLLQFPPDPQKSAGVLHALVVGKPLLYPSFPESILESSARNTEHLELLHRLGARSVIVAPLLARGHTLGSILLVRTEEGRRYGKADLELANEVAQRASLAVDNARLYHQAQEANAAKDQFVTLISHELRNPLAPILTGVEILRRGIPDNPRLQHTVEIIERNAKLQSRLVNDLLDLSRIARGKIELQIAPLALDAVVQAATQAYLPETEKEGLTLQVNTQPDLWVHGDFDRLQQVVMNLISNAVKFTAPGGEIRVTLERLPDIPQAPGIARIVVEDTGIGISSEVLPKLFQMFQQGPKARQRRPGLGIGLAIVRSITLLHNGRVWAESEGLGKGSRFIIELPLIEPPLAQAAPEVTAVMPVGTHPVLLLVEDNPDT